ncbi:multiubiquitin domain-containing protein [Bradyrhizobium genosp. P]|uniref:multiubiquitin domain-containing protein n=1 Tax=Bradyrhizobium genosp. P TaxID=83641 RepID=UPI003CF1D76B
MSADDSSQKTRIHVDGRPLELPNPIPGEALYAAAHVPEGEVFYREVTGDREDELISKDAPSIRLVQDEHFYASHPHKVEHVIIVNARRKTVTGKKISFERVVKLAFPETQPSPQTVYTVAYSNGPARNREGKMVPGQTVKIQDGMVFDVTETSRS